MALSRRFAPVAAAGALVAVVTGCSLTDNPPAAPPLTGSSTSAPAKAPVEAADHRKLLLEAKEISTAEDEFSEKSYKANPGGQEGVSTFFVNQDDTKAVEATILVLPDAAAASAAKDAALSSAATIVTAGRPEPIPVGEDGTMLSGTAPDGSKAVALVLFTQDRAVVKMEFGSATTDPTPTDQLTDIAQKQSIAVRAGLSA